MLRGLIWAGHVGWILFLTLLTQLGGLAWLIALRFRQRVLVFLLVYAALWGAALQIAPFFGRVALPCFGETLRAQSVFYCVTMRHFVTPEMADVAQNAADQVAQEYPGTQTLYLDGNLPFWEGFPLIPHLSHDDGEKLDFAFFYRDANGFLPGQTRSPIGYFVFETLEVKQCPDAWPTMRWSLTPLQPLWSDFEVDRARTRALTQALLNDPRVSKLFLEPPLAKDLGLSDEKLRFQGCRAARHDDHLHLQL